MLTRRNFKRAYLNATKDMKDFLLSAKSREFFIFLFFFLIAGGFWLLQTLNNDYETEFSIPVRLKNVPNNIVITSEPSTSLKLTVKDKGTALLNYKLSRKFFPVTLDFSDYNGVNNHVRIYSTELQKKVQAQLNASTQLLSIKPDTLDYIYATGESKRVPIKLKGSVSAARMYYLSDTIFSPDSVLVYAPKKALDSITVAYTQPVNIDNISDTLNMQVALNQWRGIKFVPPVVDLQLPVDIYTEKTVEVPIVGVNFPTDRILRTFPSKVKVTFQVGLSQFRQVTEEDFQIEVSYEELMKLGTDKYTIKLRSYPSMVNQLRVNPTEVDFLIEQISSEYAN